MIKYTVADATNPGQDALIAHVTNTEGVWGAGFVVPLGDRWPEAKDAYHALKQRPLGFTQFVPVGEPGPNLWVANMHAMSLNGRVPGRPALREWALTACLFDSMMFAYARDLRLVMPRIGAGIGGGSWKEIELDIEMAALDAANYIDQTPAGDAKYPQEIIVCDLQSDRDTDRWPGTQYTELVLAK